MTSPLFTRSPTGAPFGPRLIGPYRPTGLLGPARGLGAIGAGITAFRIGWGVGTRLDQRFGWSNSISTAAANRSPRSLKWWIHRHL